MTNDQIHVVGVFGLGTMGAGMARSLLREGIETVVWDRSRGRSQPFAALGATVTANAEDAANQSDIAITMVADADAVLAVADEYKMLGALPANATWLQMSTVGVAGFDRIVQLVDAKRPDVALFDAPVSGTKEHAEAGQLTIFASGPDDQRDGAQRVFDAIAGRTVWLGPAGLGSGLKLVNNLMLAFVVEGMSEAISLAHSLGLTTEAVIQAIGIGPLASPYTTAKLDRIARNDYDPEFSLSLALKDVHLALDTAVYGELPTLASLAREWQYAEDRGFGSQDVTAVVRALAVSS
jgi:3-hydroxyisobutyrate dehydrogenase